MANKERNMRNECWSCQHKENVPGNSHIQCNKPDPNMKGNAHGRASGWFWYPTLFDPVWKESDCVNYKEKKDE